MLWLKAKLFYKDLIERLDDVNIRTKQDLNIFLRGLYNSELLMNTGNKPIEHEYEDRMIGVGSMTITQEEVTKFNTAVEIKYPQLPGDEPLVNPFKKLT